MPARTITPIDQRIASRLLERRKALRLTQKQLAAMLDITFQQVQKYESATNRVSAARLYDMANALTIDVGYFYATDEDSTGAQ